MWNFIWDRHWTFNQQNAKWIYFFQHFPVKLYVKLKIENYVIENLYLQTFLILLTIQVRKMLFLCWKSSNCLIFVINVDWNNQNKFYNCMKTRGLTTSVPLQVDETFSKKYVVIHVLILIIFCNTKIESNVHKKANEL